MTMAPMCPHRHMIGSYCPHCPGGRAENHVPRSRMPDIAVIHKHGYEQAVNEILEKVLTYDNLRPKLSYGGNKAVGDTDLRSVLHRARKEVRALLPEEEDDDI